MAKEWSVFHRSRRWVRKRPCRWLPTGKGMYWLLTRGRRYAIRYSPFRGVRAVAWFRRDAPYGASLNDAEVVVEEADVKKVKITERSAVKHIAALETEYLSDCVAVVDSIAMLQYDDGSPRQGGYLGVWTQGSAWVARITDKDGEATLTAEGRTLDEALDLLTLLLGADDAPWEPISRRKKKS